jgi:hypothetical protein
MLNEWFTKKQMWEICGAAGAISLGGRRWSNREIDLRMLLPVDAIDNDWPNHLDKTCRGKTGW